jgi:hypothetical protein
MARDRISKARDPVKMGLKVAGEIRKIAEKIENEVMADSLSATEASYVSDGTVGMGIGVL